MMKVSDPGWRLEKAQEWALGLELTGCGVTGADSGEKLDWRG